MARSVLACPECGKPLPPEVQNRQMVPKRWYCAICHTESHRSELVRLQDLATARTRKPHKGPRGEGGGIVSGTLSKLDFPKPWLYYGTNGFGYPIMGSSWSAGYDPGNFNAATIASIARFPLVTINVHPFASQGASDGPNRAIIGRLKAINPTIKIYWYDAFVQTLEYLTAGSQWKAVYDLAASGSPDYRLWCEDGTTYPNALTSPPAGYLGWFDTGRVKAALLAIWLQYGWTARDTEGFFLDYANGTLYGTGFGLSNTDLTRTAWTTSAELDASGKAGLDHVVDGLKAQGAKILANGTADATSVARWYGRLFEGWGLVSGINGSQAPSGFVDFDTAMASLLTWQGSTATGDGTGLTKSENDGITWNTAAWRKAARFTLGSATIAGGYGYTGDNRNANHLALDDADMWADEYSVLNGTSETTGAGMGWLGRPTEFGSKDSGGCWIRHFQNGLVVVNGDGTTSHSYNPGSGYRKIRGIYDTTVNDGSVVSGSQTIPGKDARFYLRG